MNFLPNSKSIFVFCIIFVFKYSFSEPIEANSKVHQEKIDEVDSWFHCPEGWILNSDSSKCISVFNATQSWSDSRDFCRTYRGDLVSIHSEIDLILVKNIISEDSWIGLNDIEEEGFFVWSDSSDANFASWAPGEPNNINGTENCVDLSENANFDFTDDDCTDRKRFICEQMKDGLVPEYRCPQSWIMNSNSSKCFHVINISQTWQDSLDFCRTFGDDLASIHGESDFVLAKSLVSVDTWIGLNDIEIDGKMVWSDSSDFDFVSWGTGQPDNGNLNESCVSLHYDLDFDFADDNCYLEKSFLCEKIPDNVYRCPDGWILNSDSSKCFGEITATHSWKAVRNLCREFGGDLASIHSDTDFTLATSLLTENTWIGLNDRDQENTFVWSDSSPVDYTRWNGGEPNDNKGEDCVEMIKDSNFGFNDLDCGEMRRSLCEIFVHTEDKATKDDSLSYTDDAHHYQSS